MAISKYIKETMSSKSAGVIRKMFEEGMALKAVHGADNVFDFSIGNPDLNPPKEVQETMKKLAERAGVSPSTMERIENGENVKIENILNVMRALSLLNNLDIVIPEQEVIPTIVIERRVKRQRVRRKKENNANTIDWKWGDASF